MLNDIQLLAQICQILMNPLPMLDVMKTHKI